MDYVFLGRTGVRVSELSFGTMSFGGDADEAMSAKLYAQTRDAGVTFYDTADVYAGGRSEEILGRLMAHERDELVVASKAYFPTGKGPNERGSSRYHLVRAVEASLRRLATDRIDILYLHRFDDKTALEESLRGLELLVQQGKILYPAASNFSAWQTMQALGISERQGWAPLACIQPMYNLVKRQAEVELLPMAEAMGLGVCTYSPLAGADVGSPDDAETPARIRDNPMYAARYEADAERRIAASFTALANERGVHPVSLAIAWTAAQRAVTCPILGARNTEQLSPALASVEVEIDTDLQDAIAAISPAPPLATDRAEERKGATYGAR